MTKSFLRFLRFTVFCVLLTPLIVSTCSRTLLKDPIGAKFFIKISVGVLIIAGLFSLFERLLSRFNEAFKRLGREQARFLDDLPEQWVGPAIIVSAAISLFLELAMIRWQSSIFPIFSFYKNFSLLACFAGLGLGYALARRQAIPLFLAIPILTVQAGLLMFMRYGMGYRMMTLWNIPMSEQLNMGISHWTGWQYVVSMYSFFAVVFLLTVSTFIPIGQLCGRLMARRQNLPSYGFNLLGSIAGTALMIAMSFLWTSPIIWFSVGFATLTLFLLYDNRALGANAVFAFAAIITLSWPVSPGEEVIFSPYQDLTRGKGERGLTLIRAAGHYYQRVHDLSKDNANVETDIFLKRYRDYFDFPYMVYGETPERVAIMGAGMGNDASAAVRAEAGTVDAIEIDPAIVELGRQYHPEAPYARENVNAIVNDARTFLRNTDNEYDMIVYGLLDSHTLLSHASSVRLDSFVYTVEGLREARERLKDNGLLSLSFCYMGKQMGRKIYLMMREAFGGIPPVCVRASYDLSIIFMQRKNGGLDIDPALMKKIGFEDITKNYTDPSIETDVSTDDWPFFYMPKRVYPVTYLGMLALILILSAGATRNFISEKPDFSSVTFFFLGAGFMLVETKAITEMGLTFGNTWQVIGIVICGILSMAFLANLVVWRFGFSHPALPFVLLIGSLGFGLTVSYTGGLDSSFWGRVGTVVILTCPMFFSGIVFSTLLRNAGSIAGVMAINLIGAMTGGVLEYNSMYFGFRFLYILAMALYALAFLAWYLRARRSTD